MGKFALTMNIQTRDFGELTVEEEDIVTFIHPIFGFENLSRYVFLFNQSECSQFAWLQSVEDKNICFILADSSLVMKKYTPYISKHELKELEIDEPIVWLIVVINEDFSKSTVNLKSPIILNTVQRKAMQVILEQDYPIKHPLVQTEKDGI